MGNIKTSHIVEVSLWLALVIFLFIYSFEFNKDIEIYKYGASSWPRAILLLIAIAAVGQFLYQIKRGDGVSSSMMQQATDDGAEQAAQDSTHNTFGWYMWTLLLLCIPFVYMNLPEWIAGLMGLEKGGLHVVKLISAAVLVAIYGILMKGNHLGAILALPILFAAFLQDFGFYAMAPLFILTVMFLMGERRFKHMGIIMLGIYAIIIFMFVSVLYVGLPTGNISPFYEFGTQLVNIFQ